MTKTIALLICVLATSPVHAQALQMNDPNFDVLVELVHSIDDAWYRDDKSGAWLVGDDAGDLSGARCMRALAAVTKAGVPGSRKVPLKNDNPQLMRGEHSIDEIRRVCTNIERLAKIRVWEKWATEAAKGSSDPKQFERCLSTYDEMIKAGIAKTAKVQERELTGPAEIKIKWSGTVDELRKKFCEAPLKKLQTEAAEREAPYRKALKADKLSMALTTGSFYISGGAVTGDAKKLASAAVWFSDTQSVNSDRKTCKTGEEIHTVHRYQFDGAHKLVKTTDSVHCGKVPARAFK